MTCTTALELINDLIVDIVLPETTHNPAALLSPARAELLAPPGPRLGKAHN